MTFWKRGAAALLLTGVSLAAGSTSAGRQAIWSTRDFFCYYQELSSSNRPESFWDRVGLSLILASTAPKPVCARQCPRPAWL